MKKISQQDLDRLRRKKGVKIKRKLGAQPVAEKPEPVTMDGEVKSGATPSEQPVPASIPTPPAPAPAPVIDMQPFAAMSASVASSNARLEKVVANNTKALERLADSASEVRQNVPYRHKVKRTAKLLIDEIISTPMEMKR